MLTLQQRVLNLRPRPLQQRNLPGRSLQDQILRDHADTLTRQSVQFNLGNRQIFTDPQQASDYLLKREYGDSFLFDPSTSKEPIFIPTIFVSKQHQKQDVAMLEFDVHKDLWRTLSNLEIHQPTYWLTYELRNFVNSQPTQTGELCKKSFDEWIFKVRILYLSKMFLKEDHFPKTTEELQSFVQQLHNVAQSQSVANEFTRALEEFATAHDANRKRRKLKREINELSKVHPASDSNLKWLLCLELSELGEKTEHWLYNELKALQNGVILHEMVVLHSVDFLTDLRTSKSQEFDFLIICYQRKLVIGIESKRTLNEKAFAQLDKYLKVFEERLCDQLDVDWTFVPVLCIEKDNLFLQNKHYISTQTNIAKWLQSLISAFPLKPHYSNYPNGSLEQLRCLLKIIIFTIHQTKTALPCPITTTNHTQYTSESINSVSTVNNILFYSQNQLPVFIEGESRYNKLIIEAGFGTGKSFLLQQKALVLSRLPEYRGHIMYVVLFKDNTEGSLLYHHLKLYLEPHGIKVMTAQNESANLEKLIQNYNVKALFLDEWLVTPNLSRISEQVEVMWIAPNALSILNAFTDDEEMKSKFKSLNLSFNMRNSHEVVRSSKKLAKKMLYRYETGLVKPPVLFPTGTTPLEIQTVGEFFVNVVPNKMTGILVIADAKQKSAFDHLLAIINTNHTNKKIKVYSQWKNDFTGSLINPIQFLKDGNILVTTTNWASGFEWDTVVLITFEKKRNPFEKKRNPFEMKRCSSEMKRYFVQKIINPFANVCSDFRIEGHPCNAMLRCTTHLIKFRIVLEPEFGAEQDRNKKLFNSDRADYDD